MKIHHPPPQKVKLGQNSVFWAELCNLAKSAQRVAPPGSTGRAPLQLILRNLKVSKLSKIGLVGKVYVSTFQPNWNFWIWRSFALSKLNSPKITSCNSKKGQKVKFCMYFDLLEAQNPIKTQVHPQVGVTLHEKSKNAEFLSI